jgi:hypothetical protein
MTNYPLEFVPHDGWYPLPRMSTFYKGTKNPYFGNMGSYARSRVSNHIHLKGPGYAYKYRIRRRGVVTLYSGLLSSIGLSKNLDLLPSSLVGMNKIFRMYGEPDIFCIGVVKPSKLPELKLDGGGVVRKNRPFYSRSGPSMEIIINPDDVTIFVSIDKLRKTLFMKECYTMTVRNEVLWQIKKLEDDLSNKIKIVDVPDEYLTQFINFPEQIRTNSMIEAMRIEEEIKENVFSNLNDVLYERKAVS